ncbi:MAG: hypothetical protein ACLQPD_23790 [Desulfomonilaceae bacterium]
MDISRPFKDMPWVHAIAAEHMKQDTPKVSTGMPVHNGALLIRRGLDRLDLLYMIHCFPSIGKLKRHGIRCAPGRRFQRQRTTNPGD